MNLSVETIGITLAGILLCFTGWHLFKFSAKIIGFIMGASIGYTLAVFALETAGHILPVLLKPWVIPVSAILIGLLGIVLIKTIIKVALFISGFLFGILLVSIYSGGVSEITHIHGVEMILKNISIWSVISGAVFGVLFVLFQKGFIILYTCAVGAYLIMTRTGAPVYLFYGLLVIGTAVQFWISKGSRVKDMKVAKA